MTKHTHVKNFNWSILCESLSCAALFNMLYILSNRDNKPCFNTSCFKTQVLSSQRNSIVNPPPYAYCYTPFSPIIVSSIFLSLFIPSAFHVLRSALPSSPLCPATSHLLLCFTAARSHTFSGKLYFSNMAASAGRVIGLCSGFTVSCFALWFLGKGILTQTNQDHMGHSEGFIRVKLASCFIHNDFYIFLL